MKKLKSGKESSKLRKLFAKDPEKWTGKERTMMIEQLRTARKKLVEVDYLKARKGARVLKVPNHPTRPQIVYNRPVPVEARGGARKWDHFYPFEEMKPGGSFWIADERGARGCTAGAIHKFAKKSGWKFTTRGEGEDGRNNKLLGKSARGVRVWRVA